MNTIKFQKGQSIALQKEIVKNWYIVLEGSVTRKYNFARLTLSKDAVIGLSETDRYQCDYIATEDTVVAAYPYNGPEDVKNIIEGQESMRNILLRASLNQRQLLLKTYSGFENLVRQFHSFVETQYNDYTNFCMKYNMESVSFPRMQSFIPLDMVHKAEDWEKDNSTALTQNYQEEYISLMQKDDALCIGAIMGACRQTHRITQGINEMVDYLQYNQEILLSEDANDIFHLYFDLLIRVESSGADAKPLADSTNRMAEIIRKLGIHESKLVARRLQEYQDYKEHGLPKTEEADEAQGAGMEIPPEEYLSYILNYARYPEAEAAEIQDKITQYKQLPDMQSTEGEAYRLRKNLTTIFYEVYHKVFMRALREHQELSPIIQMFLNFGFMDVGLTGEQNTHKLYEFAKHLDACNSSHIYTIYTWLISVYKGENEPSRNEFDLDYPAYLADQRKSGELTADQAAAAMNNQEMKLKFELENLFVSGNRVTYGKISTFCPILCEYDLINSLDKMLVTVQRLEDAIHEIRKIDYSVFYREVAFSDPERGINREMLQKEIMPDIILMPNAGTRAMMWQEIAGNKRDTSARFLFPIFTAVDIDNMMVETLGRYRWEICRRIQGVHWNDIRDRSLTSEYCDYVQFYKKNHELSADAKEKIKIALQRGRNNYREVFVKDYQNWIKFEAKGSFRLNKISRDILLRYCPFSRQVRESLKGNPVYQNSWQRFDMLNAKAIQRLRALYDRYQKAGGELTKELKDNLEYYSL